MNRLITAILGMALAAAAATAAAKSGADGDGETEARQDELTFADFEQVDEMVALTSPHSFRAIDDDSVLVWRTRSDPYLIELRRRSPDLRFARSIGVTSTAGRTHARFDDVRIDGLRYPIESIYKLTREQAERLSEAG